MIRAWVGVDWGYGSVRLPINGAGDALGDNEEDCGSKKISIMVPDL